MNAFLLLLGFRVIGKDFTLKTIIDAGIMSLFMDALSLIPQITEDALLATLFGGILYGAGRALNFIAGASSGGLDILGRKTGLISLPK